MTQTSLRAPHTIATPRRSKWPLASVHSHDAHAKHGLITQPRSWQHIFEFTVWVALCHATLSASTCGPVALHVVNQRNIRNSPVWRLVRVHIISKHTCSQHSPSTSSSCHHSNAHDSACTIPAQHSGVCMYIHLPDVAKQMCLTNTLRLPH